VFEELEPRLLLSADWNAVLGDPAPLEEPAIVQYAATPAADPAAAATQRRELVVIDTRVPDYATLVNDLLSQTTGDRVFDILIVNEGEDGIAPVSDALGAGVTYDAVHIVSHGADGVVQLGGTAIDAGSLIARAADFQSWGNGLSANADILIYGCDVAAAPQGQALVATLSTLTGADVAASDDRTGGAAAGGDWILEVAAGRIQTNVVASTQFQQQWQGALAMQPTITLPGGPVNYTEGDPPTVIDGAATVWSEHGGWQSLTVDFSANGTADDRLAIRNEGSGAGQVGISGANVTYGGTTIGTWSGGTDGSTPLVVNFNLSASTTSVQAVARNVTFENVSASPSTSPRTVRFVVDDGLASAPKTETINVTAVNDAPANSMPPAQFTDTDTPRVFSAANGNLISIADADAGSNQIEVSLTSINGTLTLSGIAGLTFTAGDGASDANMTFRGTLADANAALDGMSFAPNAGYSGAASIAINTSDLGNTGTGGALADADAISITVGSLTATFQEGVGGYTGMEDTELRETQPGTPQGNNTTITVDVGLDVNQGLVQFANVFGSGPGQIPYGSIINSASLTVEVWDPGQLLTTISLHRMLAGWDESATWSSTGNGVQLDGVEALAAADSSISALVMFSGPQTFYGLEAALQSWSDGAANNGWVIVSDSGDSWGFYSSEEGVTARRPFLTIDYTAPQPPALDLDADNSSGQPGANFAATFNEDGGPVAIADSDAVLTDTDDTNLVSLTVTITNLADGAAESLAANTGGTGITASYDSGTGVLTLSGNDTVANYQQVLRTVTYNNTSHNPGTTARVITFVANDGSSNSNVATTTVTVAAVNDAPVITSNGGGASAAISIAENQTAVTTVTATDADLPAQTLAYSIAGGADAARFTINSVTGALAFNTAPDFENPADGGGDNVYDVVVQVSDGTLSDTQTLAVTVTAVNDNTPVITSNGGGDNATISIAENQTAVTTVTATDADLPAQTLTYTVVSGADQALFQVNAATGELRFNVAPDFENPMDADANNIYDVWVMVNDGGSIDWQVMAVTVTDVSDLQIGAVSDSDAAANAVNENAAIGTTVGVTALASDPDTVDTVSYTLDDDAGGRFAINPATGAVTVANGSLLDYETATSHAIVVRATSSDGTFSTQGFTINVTPVNDNPPVITSNGGGASAAISVAENQTAVTTVTAADADLPAQTLTYSIAGGADAARFAINASSGVLTFNVAPDFENPADGGGDNVYDVIVQVTDGTLADTQTLAVTVTNANEAPVGSNGTVTTGEDTAYVFTTGDFGFSDADAGDALSAVRIESLPAAGALTLSGAPVNANDVIAAGDIVAGNLVFTPALNGTGAPYATFGFSVRDAGGLFAIAPATITLNVTPANDPPAANDDNFSIAEDNTLTVAAPGLIANDSDADGDAIGIVSYTNAANGSVVANADGSFTYTPNADFNGADSFSYTGGDGNGGLATATVAITVTTVNDHGHGRERRAGAGREQRRVPQRDRHRDDHGRPAWRERRGQHLGADGLHADGRAGWRRVASRRRRPRRERYLYPGRH